MKLYYDNTNNVFSLTKTETNECIFESYEREERIGWAAGANPVIKKGPFEIKIGTNFYPKAPHRECLCVTISVDGVQLLPLSKAIWKATVHYHLGKTEMAKRQYGIKDYSNRHLSTIAQIKDQINWGVALTEVCQICNNYKQWIIDETRELLSKLLETKQTSFYNIATLIELVRVYDEIVPEIIPIYREFVDTRCVDAMKGVLDYIGKGLINSCGLDDLNKAAKAKNGDIIWQYIKDYYLKVEKSN